MGIGEMVFDLVSFILGWLAGVLTVLVATGVGIFISMSSYPKGEREPWR